MSISSADAIRLATAAIDAGATVAKAIAEGRSDDEVLDAARRELASYRAVELAADVHAKTKFPGFRP